MLWLRSYLIFDSVWEYLEERFCYPREVSPYTVRLQQPHGVHCDNIVSLLVLPWSLFVVHKHPLKQEKIKNSDDMQAKFSIIGPFWGFKKVSPFLEGLINLTENKKSIHSDLDLYKTCIRSNVQALICLCNKTCHVIMFLLRDCCFGC